MLEHHFLHTFITTTELFSIFSHVLFSFSECVAIHCILFQPFQLQKPVTDCMNLKDCNFIAGMSVIQTQQYFSIISKVLVMHNITMQIGMQLIIKLDRPCCFKIKL